MKYLKILGLAVVAAMALTALFGAGSASASGQLCKDSVCASLLANGTNINGNISNPPAKLTASPEVQCNTSSTNIKVNNSINGTGEVTALTFGTCKTGNTACNVNALHLPYHATADFSATTGNGTLTVTGKTVNTPPEAQVNCAGFLNCAFGNNLFSLPIVGSNTPTVTANGVSLLKISGFLCPASAKWDATYQSNTPVFVH